MEDILGYASLESNGPACPDPSLDAPDKSRRERRRSMLFLGGIAAALPVAIVIVIVVCCGRKVGFKTTNDLMNAVVEALKADDGQRLLEMTELSEKFLESNPGLFGESDSPEDIMRTYYADLAGPFAARLKAAYGEDCDFMPWFESIERTETDAETGNLAFGLEAEEYMEKYGFFTVDGEVVADAYIVMAKLNGRWRLIVVTLQDEMSG